MTRTLAIQAMRRGFRPQRASPQGVLALQLSQSAMTYGLGKRGGGEAVFSEWDDFFADAFKKIEDDLRKDYIDRNTCLWQLWSMWGGEPRFKSFHKYRYRAPVSKKYDSTSQKGGPVTMSERNHMIKLDMAQNPDLLHVYKNSLTKVTKKGRGRDKTLTGGENKKKAVKGGIKVSFLGDGSTDAVPSGPATKKKRGRPRKSDAEKIKKKSVRSEKKVDIEEQSVTSASSGCSSGVDTDSLCAKERASDCSSLVLESGGESDYSFNDVSEDELKTGITSGYDPAFTDKLGKEFIDNDDGITYRIDGFRKHYQYQGDPKPTICYTFYNIEIKPDELSDDDVEYAGVLDMLQDESYTWL